MELVAAPRTEPAPPEPAEEWPALRARRRGWAELLRRVFRIEVEVCPRCGGAMRMVAFVTEPAVVRRILAYLERRGVEARAGPWEGPRPRRGDGRRGGSKGRGQPPERVGSQASGRAAGRARARGTRGAWRGRARGRRAQAGVTTAGPPGPAPGADRHDEAGGAGVGWGSRA